jgi:nickel-dependent lactate racemase
MRFPYPKSAFEMALINLPVDHNADTLSVRIPDALLGEVVRPMPVQPAADPDAEIRDALEKPIGAPPVEQIVRPGQRVAVIVDDITRETPTRLMLPPVLARLEAAGIPRGDIRVVIALGTHRPMTEAEIPVKVGPAVVQAYEIVNVPSWEEDRFVCLGMSSSGIPARVLREVAGADVRIGLGGIIPHVDAGFSGGAKIVLPGVCSDRTVDAFHARGAAVETNLLGVFDGPMRKDLEQFVGQQVELHFILNAVLTREGELYRCVAGHFIEAHRAGVRMAQEVYCVPVARRYPLVIANSFPANIDLWQSSKCLWVGEKMVSDGGMLVLVTPCKEGINVHPLYPDYIGRDPDDLQKELEEGRVEDPNACGGAIPVGRMKRRIRFGLVSPGLSRVDADRMGFAYYASVEEAVDAELGESPEPACVGVLTHSDFTIPLVQ